MKYTTIILFLFLSACSLYQSPARKFLEDQGIDFAAKNRLLLNQYGFINCTEVELNFSNDNNHYRDLHLPEELMLFGFLAKLNLLNSSEAYLQAHLYNPQSSASFLCEKFNEQARPLTSN